MVQPLSKSLVAQKVNTKLPYDQAILLLGLHPKELKVGTQTETYICIFIVSLFTSLVAQRVKRRPGFNPWVRKIPWRRKWQPIPVFLPGESHGRRSLVGYSPLGRKESDMTERPHFLSFSIHNRQKMETTQVSMKI